MLVSYALENLLKALFIKSNRRVIEEELINRNGLPNLLKSHDLFKLAKELNVLQIESGEELLLRQLSRSAVWFGRYPIPSKASDLESSYTPEFPPFPEYPNMPLDYRQHTNTDIEEIDGLILRVRDKISEKPP